MSKKQPDLFDIWSKNNKRQLFTCDSSSSASTNPLSPHSVLNVLSDHHNDDTSTSIEKGIRNRPDSKSTSKKNSTSASVRNYLRHWEKTPEAMYRTYIFDEFGGQHENYLPWLYLKNNSMHCSLCEKHRKLENVNGSKNLWSTTGYTTFLLDKIKKHKNENTVHQAAEQLELDISSRAQPNLIATQAKEVSEQKRAIQNLMFACIYICHQYQPLNSLESLCVLFEKMDAPLIPSTLSVVNYRNNDAALCFLQHIGGYLHEELIGKIKSSPVVGWMMDESTSRTVEKSCIVYVRYLEDYTPMTSFYGILGMKGDGTAANIVKTISDVWRKDDLNPINSCWFASDNASTFTGIHEGVVARLRRYLGTDYLESNTCALVGSHASYKIDPVTNMPVVHECISNMETLVGKIYNYFGGSCHRQHSLKEWQNFLDIPQLEFKRIDDIRWSSIQDCLKPIIQNVQPGNQELFVTLQQNACDRMCTNADQKSAKDLLQCVLNDEFLFLLHFHHDLHQCALGTLNTNYSDRYLSQRILGPITKLVQHDKVSYYHLMQEINEKKNLMLRWISQSTFTWGPTLANYIKETEKETFGAFKIKLCDRQKVAKQCSDHIERLINELDKCFTSSSVQENMAVLFDPRYLIEHKTDISSPEYGRSALDFLRDKYKNLIGFDSDAVQIEWELLKPSLSDFIDTFLALKKEEQFWQEFLLYKRSRSDQFLDQNKNVLLLLSIYLISPTNSAEFERGFSVANRIQTTDRSRMTIPTLEVLMTVRLLLTENLKSARCQQVVDRSFDSWNDSEKNRRLNANKRKRTSTSTQSVHIKPKKPKSKAIKCANGCQKEISNKDPNQREAIQCCHQSDEFDWVDQEKSCSRWLCNGCRIKLGISMEGFWFCSDHVEMRSEEESESEDNNE